MVRNGSETASPISVERGGRGRRTAGIQRAHAALARAVNKREGIAAERRLFKGLVEGVQSRAQRYMFFAERAAAKIDGLPEGTATRPVKRVGIVGAGTMGGGIAMNFLNRGIAVTIVETQAAALERGSHDDRTALVLDYRC